MADPFRVPVRNVQLHTGERVPLADFYRKSPLALIFLRHLGCIFCKEQVAMLREASDLNIAFVCMAAPADAQAFRESMQSPQSYFCEPEGDLYREFNLSNGSLLQLAGPRVIGRGVQATFKGFMNNRPNGNPKMLGAAFAINTEGFVSWEHRARDAADNVGADEVRSALQNAVVGM